MILPKSVDRLKYLSFTPLKIRIHWGIGLDCWHFDSKVGRRSAVCGRDYGGPWNKGSLKFKACHRMVRCSGRRLLPGSAGTSADALCQILGNLRIDSDLQARAPQSVADLIGIQPRRTASILVLTLMLHLEKGDRRDGSTMRPRLLR